MFYIESVNWVDNPHVLGGFLLAGNDNMNRLLDKEVGKPDGGSLLTEGPSIGSS